MPDTPERTPPRVRVVVLNWNSWWFTRRCLRALARTEYPAGRLEVVLVDNASVDGSLERLRHEFPALRVVCNEANLGFAEGCNRAMRDLAGVDLVALVNNDAVVEPGWLEPMVEALEQHPDAGAAAARLVLEPAFAELEVALSGGSVTVDSVRVDGIEAVTRTRFLGSARSEGRTEWPMELVHHLDGDARIMVPVGEGDRRVDVTLSGIAAVELRSGSDRSDASSDGSAVTLSVRVAATQPRRELLNGLGTDRNEVGESFDRHFGQPNDPDVVPELSGGPFPVTGFSGGGVLLRAAMLRQVGVFDPRFFAYYEDSDLSWRAARAGWSTVAVPGAVIRHAFGGSGGSRAPGFFFLNYRNWLLTVLRSADPELRRRALGSARERLQWALRANVASPVRHRRRPRWELVGAWTRVLAGAVAVRVRARRGAGPVGATPTTTVRSAFQPTFAPRAPAPRPAGPGLVALDLTDELAGAAGPGASLLAAMSASATLDPDVVPVARGMASRWRRVAPSELGRLLQVPGPHRAVDAPELDLGDGVPGAVVVTSGGGRLVARGPDGDERPVPSDPAGLAAALADLAR